MKKEKNRGAAGRQEKRGSAESPERAYVYMVKNPSSNEMSICAWDSVLYPGTQVIAPTRYGLDLGMVMGSAADIGGPYKAGCPNCQGACLRSEPLAEPEPQQELEEESSFDAVGEVVEDQTVIVSQDGEDQVEFLLEAPAEVMEDAVATEEIVVEEEAPAVPFEWDPKPDEDQCACCGGCAQRDNPREIELDGDVEWIERLATPDDLRRAQEQADKEREALRLCREKVAKHKLDMKLVTAHYLAGEPKLLFFFTADVRVDFRELVKDLVNIFRIRIELRQIGVRDESRVLGGLAVCGRDFCCHSVTDKLNPVSIKMAKEQNLSLNSMKISGPCGRLLCCLSYEYDFYVEEKQCYPPEGSRLKVGHDLMKVTEVNILSKKISLSGPDGRYLTIPGSAVDYNGEMNRWEIRKEYLDEFLSN